MAHNDGGHGDDCNVRHKQTNGEKVTDDIVTRLEREIELSDTCICNWMLEDAVDEIKRLRAALALAVAELITHAEYAVYSPDQLMQQFIEEARRG